MNYPFGANTKDAPWNQPDLKEFYVSVRIRVMAGSKDEAKDVLAENIRASIEVDVLEEIWE